MDEELARRLDAIERRLAALERGPAGADWPVTPLVRVVPSPVVGLANRPTGDGPAVSPESAPPPLPRSLAETHTLDPADPAFRFAAGLTVTDAQPTDAKAADPRADRDDHAKAAEDDVGLRADHAGLLGDAATPPVDAIAAAGGSVLDGGPPPDRVAEAERLAAAQADIRRRLAAADEIFSPRPGIRPPAPPTDFEHVVGLKWAGWVGAIVLVIGAALGIKFAYDEGWFGGLSDAARCAMIAAGGVALLGLGEVVFRRINKLAATGFYGAGISVLYLAVYAGQSWYELFGGLVATLLLTCVAGMGVLVAARADLVAVACIAVIGAVVCPAFTGVLDVRPPGFRLYLLAVEAMALGLCAWRAKPKWWVLRAVALAATAFDLFVGTPGERIDGFVLPGVVFGLIAAALFQGEVIFTTWRRPKGRPSEPVPGVVFSLLVTAVLVVSLLQHLALASAHARGEMLVWLALAVTTTGLFIARRSVSLTLLGRGYFVQAMMLLALAVPVSFEGPERIFGWMILSAGLGVLALWSGDRAAAVATVVIWLLASPWSGNWLDEWIDPQSAWLTVGGEAIKAAVCVAAFLTVAGHFAAFVLHRTFGSEPHRPGRPTVVSAGLLLDLLVALTFVAAVMTQQSAAFGTRAAFVYAIALWTLSLWRPTTHLQPVGQLVLLATSVKWAVYDVLGERLWRGWKPAGTPFWNAQTATGAALAAGFGLTGWVDRHRAVDAADPHSFERSDTVWTLLASAAIATVGFATANQIDLGLALRFQAFGPNDWPGGSDNALWMTVVVAGCIAAWALLLRVTLHGSDRRAGVWRAGRVAAYLLTAKFVIVDVMMPAFADVAPTPPAVLNLQVVVAAVLIGLIALLGRRTPNVRGDATSGLFVLGLLLVTGSAEIDRYALRQTDAPVWIVRQVGWSIYWGLLAVATLCVGFALHGKRLRVTALCLLTATLLKLVVLDMAGVGTGWRILSFLGLGALLLLTSVLYGRFRELMPQDAK